MRLAVLLAAVLALSGCAGSGNAPTSPAETSPVERTPSPSSSPSLQPASVQPSRDPGEGSELTGVLGADAVEGGCGYLQTVDGTRYEVIYPQGWQLRISPLELISPEGEVVARGGDEVTVRGSVADDMASICQIGPIYRATEVLSGG